MPGLFDGAFRRGGLLADLGASESDSVPTTAEMRVPPMRSPAHDLASLAWRGVTGAGPEHYQSGNLRTASSARDDADP